MGAPFAQIAFTPSVKAAQSQYGSRAFAGGVDESVGEREELTANEADYMAQIDGFFQARVSQTGWPYVQFSGGPPEFLKAMDPRTIAFVTLTTGTAPNASPRATPPARSQ
jgi:uncharacterized protein